MKKFSKADLLLFAAFVVAAPRFMGVFGMAVGLDLVRDWPFFAEAEVWSGLAMALLEGLALAYISKRWRRLPDRGIYWRLLLGLQAVLILALPLTVTPYLVATQLGRPVIEVLPAPLFWMWNFLVAAISPFVAVAVGIVEDDRAGSASLLPERLRAWDALLTHGRLTPDELAKLVWCEPATADRYIQEWVGVEGQTARNGRTKERVDQ